MAMNMNHAISNGHRRRKAGPYDEVPSSSSFMSSSKTQNFLSNIQLLGVDPSDNYKIQRRLERVDATLRDIHLETKTPDIPDRHNTPPPQQPQEESKVDESLTQDDNAENKVLLPRIKFATSIQYQSGPESIINVIENWIKMNATGLPEDGIDSCQHCTSKEVLQTQHIAQITAWRKAVMSEVNNFLS